MKDLFHYVQSGYFTSIVSLLTSLVCYIGASKMKCDNNDLGIFRFYFLSYAILIFYNYVAAYFNTVDTLIVDTLADFVFTVFEFLTFMIYFNRIFIELKNRQFIKTVSVFFLIFAFTLAIKDLVYDNYIKVKSLHTIYNIQAIALIVPCCLYYCEMFFKKPYENLLNQPEFWIISGLSIFMLSTLPFSLLTNHLISIDRSLFEYLYSIFNIFYCILFVFILKGFKCNSRVFKVRYSTPLDNYNHS
jgi:hypothetical protein